LWLVSSSSLILVITTLNREWTISGEFEGENNLLVEVVEKGMLKQTRVVYAGGSISPL
jgi:hypothetical protein